MTVKFVLLGVVAAFLGIYSANAIKEGRYGIVSQRIGVWTTWPSAGTSSVDPYTRAHFISKSRLPLSRFEALEYETEFSSGGKLLDSDCTYLITGQIPAARRWSLSSFNTEQADNFVPAANSSLSSPYAVSSPTNTIAIKFSKEPAPGNWLEPNGDGPQALILRLFNPTYVAGRDTIANPPLSIKRLECR